jgi:hypothetical protein
MFARVATFEGVNVQAARETMDEAEALIRPLVEGIPGFQGYLDLMSEGGKMISIVLFDSEASAGAAEPVFDEEMPKKLGHIFSEWEGKRVSVDRYAVIAQSSA